MARVRFDGGPVLDRARGLTAAERRVCLKRACLTPPRSPRLRNPDQLRRGERYPPRHTSGGSVLDADRGQFCKPIDSLPPGFSPVSAVLASRTAILASCSAFSWDQHSMTPISVGTPCRMTLALQIGASDRDSAVNLDYRDGRQRRTLRRPVNTAPIANAELRRVKAAPDQSR